MAEAYDMKLPPGDNHWTSLMISQHWFRLWLGAVRQQAITWANVDPDQCHHMASLGHRFFKYKWYRFLPGTITNTLWGHIDHFQLLSQISGNIFKIINRRININKNKIRLRLSDLHNGISYIGTASLYWIRALASIPLTIFQSNSKLDQNLVCSIL